MKTLQEARSPNVNSGLKGKKETQVVRGGTFHGGYELHLGLRVRV